MEQGKVWWQSKTIWVGLISLVATIAQAKWGFIIDPLYQGYALSAIMVILRLITNKPTTLKG